MTNLLALASSAEAAAGLRQRTLRAKGQPHYEVQVRVGEWKEIYYFVTLRGADEVFHNSNYEHASIYELRAKGERALVDKR